MANRISVASVTDPHERRNFVINVVEGALFIGAASFVSVQTVLPALVTRLGGSNVAVGAVSVIAWVGLFLPQIFAARYVETKEWKKPWTVWTGLIQRSVTLLIGLSVLLFGSSYPSLSLVAFLILFAVSQMLLGVATPGWFDLFAKLTRPTKRGRLVGIRNSLAGAAAFFCSLVLTWLLGTYHFPLNYALAFFLAFLLQVASISVQWRLVEEHPSKVVPRKPFFAFLRELPAVFRVNKPFRVFVGASAFQILAAMPVGFFTVYAMKEFGAIGSTIGEFTLTMVAAQVLSALLIGFIADEYGNKIALILAALAMFCSGVSAVLAPSLDWFRLVYVFLGVNLGTEIAARYNMSVEYGPEEQRSTYVGLMNTVLSPLYLTAIIGGWLSDAFGYTALFVTGISFSVVAVGMLVFRVRDPRVVS